MTSLKGHKYLALLVVLVGAIIVQSLRHTLLAAPALLNILQTLLVVAVFLGVFEQRRTRIAALWFGIVTAVVGWSEYALPPAYFPFASAVEHSLRMVFVGYAAIVILGDIFEKRLARPDDVLGAACGYLLAGAAWANLFQVCDLLLPGSFSLSTEMVGQLATPQGRAAIFNYFSLSTLTTMGYGDIAPLRGPATAFATLEAVFGQFYIAVVVAQLVGIRLGQSGQRAREK
jgi:hypothetical protein